MTVRWFLKVALVVAIVLLPDYYVIHPSVRVVFAVLCMIVIWEFFDRAYYFGQGANHGALRIERDTRTILVLAFVFLFYIFIVDVYRDDGRTNTFVSFIGAFLTVALLPIFERGRERFELANVFKVCLFLSMIFAAIQFLGYYYTLGEMLPNLLIMRADNVWKANPDIEYFRMTGAGGNLIAFATFLMIMSSILFISLLNQFTTRKLLMLLVVLAVLLSTELRSLIFVLPPAFILIAWLKYERTTHFAVTFLPLAVLLILPIMMIWGELTEIFVYLTREITGGDTYRFSVNYHMTIGVLQESPWFGISGNDAWDIYYKYGDLNAYSNQAGDAVPTHHNQLAYYFRYYGLVGAVLFCALYVGVFKKIAAAPSKDIQLLLVSIFILDFVSSMAHNNKLVGSPILWVVLSLAASSPAHARKIFR